MADKVTEAEMLECLSRSGYLLESEITKKLNEYGFFVESNIMTLDPLTGKSREIDIQAEYYEYDNSRKEEEVRVASKVEFIFEIKNNDYPLVLLTKTAFSPKRDVFEIIKVTRTRPDNQTALDFDGYFDLLFWNENDKYDHFTQYCCFSKKDRNGQLMASHLDVIYSSLSKITQYCEENLEMWQQRRSDVDFVETIFREFLYLPVLLIRSDLYELDIVDDQPIFKKTDHSRLVFNYHYKEQSTSAIVHVITKDGFDKFLEEMITVQRKVKENIIEAIKKSNTKD